MLAERAGLCEVVGVFHTGDDLEAAIEVLLMSGFDRAQLSLLASERAVQDKLRHHYGSVAELADDPAVPRTAYVSTAAVGDAQGALIGGLTYIGATAAIGAVVMSGGALAATLMAAMVAGGAGTLLGSILARVVGRHHAEYLHRQIEKGGLLLWVRAWEPADEQLAINIMRKYGGDDVHSHDCLFDKGPPADVSLAGSLQSARTKLREPFPPNAIE
jgi:hypothetical protein